MNVIGVDGGAKGALAVYDADAKCILRIHDMPVFNMTINNKKRLRIDAVGLFNLLQMEKALGTELVMIEAVGGRPRQGASAAFVFGYGIGLVYMGCVAGHLPIETERPEVWKRFMRLPGKKERENKKTKELNGMIVARADELMPDARHMWRGEKQHRGQDVFKVDRAEAAIIAKYAGDHVIRLGTRPTMAVDTLLAYQFADTGA